MMQLLMFSWEYPPYIDGGLGRHVGELAPALASLGVTVHVVTLVSQTHLELLNDFTFDLSSTYNSFTPPGAVEVKHSVEDGVAIHRLIMPPLNPEQNIYDRVAEYNDTLLAYAQHLKEKFNYQLIHTHDWLTGRASIALKKLGGHPLVATIHATERGRGRGHLNGPLQISIDRAERDLINAANRVIVCSQHMSRELQSFFNVPVTKLDVVPNGVNIPPEATLNSDDLTDFRAEYADPEEKIVFTVSRLVYEKGIHRLIDAAPRILNECPNTQIIIAGKGPEANQLKQQADYLGVADRTNFIGFVSDEVRNRLFKVADCAVFPSLYEPFGIVALEAMALGCPVVVSGVGGLAEVVTHGKTGLTTYPDDPQSVGWGVVEALTHPELTQSYTAQAHFWVRDMFNWTRIARLTQGVYRQMVRL